MYPVLFNIGGITLYSYGVLLSLSFAITYLYLKKTLKRCPALNEEHLSTLFILALVLGVLGARLLFVMTHYNYFIQNPIQILRLSDGGLSVFGGILLAYFGCYIYLKYKSLNVIEVSDFVTPKLFLAQSIGRLGCYLNGCCYGYLVLGENVQLPSQILSAVILLLLFIILEGISFTKINRLGFMTVSYFSLYAIFRIFIEWIRLDTQPFIGQIKLGHILAILYITLAFLVQCRLRRR